MRIKVIYEWDAEQFDGDDIIDHNHYDTAAEALPLQPDERLVLVRNEWHGGRLVERLWAYSRDGVTLGVYFENAFERQTCVRVPQRFHAELAAALQQEGK